MTPATEFFKYACGVVAMLCLSSLPPVRLENEFTLEEATSVAKKSLSTENLRVTNFSLKPFSWDIRGFLSDQKLLSIDVLLTDEPGRAGANKTLVFFAKSISSTGIDYNKQIFREEAKFYGDVVPDLLNNSIAEPFMPKSYLVKDTIIVLEDLRAQGFGVVKRVLPVSHLKSALTALARYHASSLLLEEKLKKPLNEVYPGFFKEKTFVNDGAFCWKWLVAGMEVAEAIGKNLGRNSSLVPLAYELVLEKMKPVQGDRNLLRHSDLWTNNIMFAGGGDEIKCRLIDYQSVTYTSYIIDVLQLIYLDSLGDVRRRFEKELIQVYHAELNKNLRKSGYGDDRLISLDEVFQAVEDKRICGLVTAVQYFPVALLSDELISEYGKDPEKFQDYSFKSRKDFVLGAMSKDGDYRKRLEEVVEELIDYVEKR